MEIKFGYFEREEIGRVRTHQEDSHGHALGTPNGDVFVMCDGMGGHVGGKQASSMAVDCILDYLQKEEYQDKQRGLVDAIRFANRQILGYAGEHPEFTGMGTTACILLIKGDEVFIAHVGDSRIYLYLGKEQQLHRITKDHSYVQTLVDAGKITDEEAEHHPQKNRILKALGGDLQVMPDVNRCPIKPKKGDIFLLCSDGLSGMIQDGVMESVLSQETSLNQKGNQLVDIALNNGGVDNVTAQLVEVISSPHKKSQFKSFNPIGRPRQSLGRKSRSGNYRKMWWIVLITLCAVLLIVFCKKRDIGLVSALFKGDDKSVVDRANTKNKKEENTAAKVDSESCEKFLKDKTDTIKEYESKIKSLEKERDSLKAVLSVWQLEDKEDAGSIKDGGSKNTGKVIGSQTTKNRLCNA